MQIFHNPRCQKSRETLALLYEKSCDPDIFLYLDEKLTKALLKQVLKKLGLNAEQLVRKSETIYKEKYKGKSLSDDEWIEAMIEYPKLIERPIVINGDKAALGRPPEKVLEIL